MDFFSDLWGFLRVRKKFWLLPVILMMALFGGLVVLSQGSAIAPFICGTDALMLGNLMMFASGRWAS